MCTQFYVVSACLAGEPCRYDGTSHPCPEVIALVQQGKALPLCPEVMGALPVPRVPCEQCAGRVIDRHGADLSLAFSRGAQKAVHMAVDSGCTAAILKTRSPSCGFGHIYDGTFTKKLVQGEGVWARALREAGFALYSEEDLP